MRLNGKLILLLLSIVSLIVITSVWKFGLSRKVIYVTESPKRTFRVQIIQKQFLIEHAAYFDAYQRDAGLVSGKLLFTGDFLDEHFQQLYPNYHWLEENLLRIGRILPAERKLEVEVSNDSDSTCRYLLLETPDNKALFLDFPARATARFQFPIWERLSCQGEWLATRERFGKAVELQPDPQAFPNQIKISLTKEIIALTSDKGQLKLSRCCAPDRPDFDHELSY